MSERPNKRSRKNPWDEANAWISIKKPINSTALQPKQNKILSKDGLYGVTIGNEAHAACVFQGKLYEPNDHEAIPSDWKNKFFVVSDEHRPLLKRELEFNIGEHGCCSLVARSIWTVLSKKLATPEDLLKMDTLSLVKLANLLPEHITYALYI